MSLGPLEQARIVLERAIARTSLTWKIVGAIGLALPVAVAALVGLLNGGSVEDVLGGSVVAYALLVFFIVFVVWASLGLLFMVRHNIRAFDNFQTLARSPRAGSNKPSQNYGVEVPTNGLRLKGDIDEPYQTWRDKLASVWIEAFQRVENGLATLALPYKLILVTLFSLPSLGVALLASQLSATWWAALIGFVGTFFVLATILFFIAWAAMLAKLATPLIRRRPFRAVYVVLLLLSMIAGVLAVILVTRQHS